MIVVTMKNPQGTLLYQNEHDTLEAAAEAVKHALLTHAGINWEQAVRKGFRIGISVGAPAPLDGEELTLRRLEQQG